MDFNRLRQVLIEKAIRGELVPQLDSEPAVESFGDEPEKVPFEIPEKWKWVRFGNVASLVNGRAYKKEELLEQAENLVPVLRVGNLFTSSKWYYSDLELETEKYCESGDLLYAWSASFGPHIWSGPKSIFHYHIWKVLCTNFVDKKWLYYWFLSKTDELKRSGHGATMIHITKTGMEQEWLALPPLEEQRRIAAVFSALEKAESAKNELNTLNNTLRSILIEKAIRGELVPQLDSEPAVESFGDEPEKAPFEIPEKWKWIKLGWVVDICSSKRVHKSDWRKVGVPFYRAREIVTLSYQGFVNNELFISGEQFESFKKFGVPEAGDLMVSAVGTLGASYVVKDEDCFYYKDASVLCFKKSEWFYPLFLKILFETLFMKQQIATFSSGITVGTITIKNAKQFLVPLPPLEEQRRIVAVFDQIEQIARALNG